MSKLRLNTKAIGIDKLMTYIRKYLFVFKQNLRKSYKDGSVWTYVYVLFFTTLCMLIILHPGKDKITDKNTEVLSVTANSEVENTNPSPPAPNSAQNLDVLKWQKNIDFSTDTDSNTTIVEEIPENQEYQSGSLELPTGWVASYATVDNPTDNDYSLTEPNPASSVRYIKLSYSTVTTNKPVSQNVLVKPLDQEKFTAPTGMSNPKILISQEYDNKLFVIYKAVDTTDGINDTVDMTINCMDLVTYQPCNDYGISFPSYLSSSTGTKFGNGTKDINTPSLMKHGFDNGEYGHAGYMYIPTQKGGEYGVSCLDLGLMENCGFISIGTSYTPNQVAGANPTLIEGFAQNGSKLYGHVNHDNVNGVESDDFLGIFCIDMATANRCTDYSSTVQSQIPSLKISEHGYEFKTVGQNIMVGDKYFFVMNYEEGNPVTNTVSSTYSQAFFGNRLVCYDVVQKAECSGWSVNLTEYRAPQLVSCGFFCWNWVYYNQNVYGTQLSPDPANQLTNGLELPRSLFVWKGADDSDKAVCLITGKASGVDPATSCYNFNNGTVYSEPISGGGVNYAPPGILPSQWLSVPWEPGSASITNNENGSSKFFQSYYLPADNLLLSGNVKSGVICYDWKTQAPCTGYRYPHYWYEIQRSDVLDAGYISDGNCMIGVSGYDFVWSFNAQTGETPCRYIQRTTIIKPQADLSNAYCDNKPHTTGWGRLRLNKSKVYDYRYFRVTIKDKDGNVLSGFNAVDLKNESGGILDIGSIPLSGNTDELTVEVDAELANTAPWGDDPTTSAVDINTPYLTVEMSGDSAQYCYETAIKDECDIAEVETTSSVTSELEFDTLENTNTKSLNVVQPESTQCFKDLKINIAADKEVVKPGELVTYTMTVENKANNDPMSRGSISGANIEASIPSGTTLYDSGGGAIVGGKINWNNESFSPKQSMSKTITVKVDGQSSSAMSSYAIFASTIGGARIAQANQNINFTAQVMYGQDVYQADNTAVLSNVSVDNSQSPDEGGGGDTGGTGSNGNQGPVENKQNDIDDDRTDETNNNHTNQPISGFTGSNGSSGDYEIQQPTSFASQIATGITNFAKIAVRPIPVQVAKPLPYILIAVLILLALIFTYEAYREIKIRRDIKRIYVNYSKSENLRNDYLNIISHYLYTPITLMKSTVEIMEDDPTVPNSTLDKIKSILNNLTTHASGLLGETRVILDTQNQGQASFDKTAINKTFRFWVIVPLATIFAITLFVNAAFVSGNKYEPSASNFLVQLVFYGLSSVALVFAYFNYKSQKYATISARNEVSYEENLMKAQETFIRNASKTLEQDALELKLTSEPIIDKPKGEIFSQGLESIDKTSHRLSYINEITNLAGTKLLDSTSIVKLTNQLIEGYVKIMDMKGITFTKTIDNDVNLKVDEQGFRQIVSSTLNNAIKFTNEGGAIELSIKTVVGGKAKIVVSDNGVGISKNKLDNLFSPFGRGTEVLNYDYEGFGLDLYTDKLIAEHNGGSIEVDSKEGKGTKVTVILPSKL